MKRVFGSRPRRAAPRSAPLAVVLALTVALGACSQPVRQIRLMTYNMHHGADASERPSLERIADLIESHDVDVIGLQEVDRAWSERSGFADQVDQLARRLDMHAFFAPIYDLAPEDPERPRRRYGLAVLSRFPIVEAQNFELTRLSSLDGDPQPVRMPGFALVAVDVEGTRLSVFNTHLDYRGDPAIRRIQVREMMEIVSGVEGPAVLLGDFNAPPEADELRPLYDTFRDAWSAAGPVSGETFPAGDPVRRIDGILVTEGIQVDSAGVAASTASDHRPVWADLVPGR